MHKIIASCTALTAFSFFRIYNYYINFLCE